VGVRNFGHAVVDLTTRSEGGSEQVAVKISFMSSLNMLLERTVIALHKEHPITPTWHANSHGVRPRQICKGLTRAVVR
jgi:hypothetical protein